METKKKRLNLKGKLVILSGPSGCGKTTISYRLLEDPLFFRSISATTRLPRPGEKHGTDYFFITEDEFHKQIEQGKFIEYAEYHNYLYGTPAYPLEDAMSKGLVALLVIEVKGALQIMDKFHDCISIFILPPDMQTLKKRLKGRDQNTPDEINQRVETALKEIEEKDRYRHCIINDDLNQTVAAIKDIVNNN